VVLGLSVGELAFVVLGLVLVLGVELLP